MVVELSLGCVEIAIRSAVISERTVLTKRPRDPTADLVERVKAKQRKRRPATIAGRSDTMRRRAG